MNTKGGKGVLQSVVYLDGITRPAVGAKVEITNPDTGEIIEVLETDSLGKTPAIELDTPPIEFSMDPTMPRPFNQYDMRVFYEKEETVEIQNVQVYPDSVAVQRTTVKLRDQSIYIPYPVLWGDFPPKIPEKAIKKMPIPTGLVVLPKPVVPEFVVVHAGVPNDASAPQYWVGFKDYVKNAACSEIYSTWPVEAIKANVLAIISFVMNRVYTEWYRGKGYNFTITNSTAYDQSFNYGRTIYKEVSQVVDELFTTYISKPDIVQPLFTQYSDGVEIVRDGWLQQWGSKNLADQGFDHLQILKQYYGFDIVLKQAEKVEGVPSSFEGKNLTIGSRGEPVRVIQRQLNAISEKFPAIPKVAVDGIFGEKTKESVRKFQEVFDLPQTGIVDLPTWYEISNIFVSVEKLS